MPSRDDRACLSPCAGRGAFCPVGAIATGYVRGEAMVENIRHRAGHIGGVILCLLLALPLGAARPSGAGARRSPQSGAGVTSLLRTVQVGSDPVAVAVDEQTQRAFVVNSGPLLEAVPSRSGAHLSQPPPGSVSVLDTVSGSLLRTVALPFWPHALAVDRRTARVFVLSYGLPAQQGRPPSRGSVSMLDARTGRVVDRVLVGPWPGAVAVDERANRVLVVDTGSPDVNNWPVVSISTKDYNVPYSAPFNRAMCCSESRTWR